MHKLWVLSFQLYEETLRCNCTAVLYFSMHFSATLEIYQTVTRALPFPPGTSQCPVISASCHSCFQFAIIFKSVAANTLVKRWKEMPIIRRRLSRHTDLATFDSQRLPRAQMQLLSDVVLRQTVLQE